MFDLKHLSATVLHKSGTKEILFLLNANMIPYIK